MSGVSCTNNFSTVENDDETEAMDSNEAILVNAEYANMLYRSDDDIYQSMFDHANDCDQEEDFEDYGAPIISGFDDDEQLPCNNNETMHIEGCMDEEMLSQEASQCLLHQSTQDTNSITESPSRPITKLFETEVFSPPAKQGKKKRQPKTKRKLRFSYPSRKRQKRNDGTAKSIIETPEIAITASSTVLQSEARHEVDDEDYGAPIDFGGMDDEVVEEEQQLQQESVCTHDAHSWKQRIWQNICHNAADCNFSNVMLPSLSVASNFVGLLHLANEHDLVLQHANNHVDVQVQQTVMLLQ